MMVKKLIPLEFSIPANNQKIIEIYNKLRSGLLIVNLDYQRKLVWKKNHKINFIETILKNYPFPEIYLSPGKLDQEDLILIDEIVDGQQRLNAIKDYIEGTDIFSFENLGIKPFSQLAYNDKNAFLNYEISVRYLKNVSQEQVKEIFQRINKTDYALNTMERVNAQWGESEFVCFAKQIIEPSFESNNINYKMPVLLRKKFIKFFHGHDSEGIFTEYDMSRMLALQYIMTLIATMDSEEYFKRNEKLKTYIEGFHEDFPQASQIAHRLETVVDFLNQLHLPSWSKWFNKANLFTLIVELDRLDTQTLSIEGIRDKLLEFGVKIILNEVGLDEDTNKLDVEELKYSNLAREAVNDKNSREFRGRFIKKLFLKHSIVN